MPACACSRPRAWCRRRRADHAQCVPHHRFHAGVLRRGPAVRVLRQAAPAAGRSRGRHGARDGTRAVPREARAISAAATGAGSRSRATRRGARAAGAAATWTMRSPWSTTIAAPRTSSAQRASRARAAPRVRGISGGGLFRSARHHPPARAPPAAGVAVADARSRAGRHDACACTCWRSRCCSSSRRSRARG